MRKEENGKLQQVICNGCGKELKIEMKSSVKDVSPQM